MENNKQHKKEKFLGKQKRKEIYGLDFPSALPKVPARRRNNTCRKWGGMFGKHLVDQYARQERGREPDRQPESEREGERKDEWETPRTQGRWMSWGNSLCFPRVLLHFSVRLSVRNVQLSSFIQPVWHCEERLVRCGWCHGCLPEVTAGFNTWLLTSKTVTLYHI